MARQKLPTLIAYIRKSSRCRRAKAITENICEAFGLAAGPLGFE